MSLFYTTVTVIDPNVYQRFESNSLPTLPFACFACSPDTRGRVVVFPESVRDVPNAGDLAAAQFSATFRNAVVVLAAVDEDDKLRLRFFQAGNSVEEYITEPGSVIGEDLPPSGGDTNKLASLFDLSDTDTRTELSRLLAAGRYDDEYGFGEAVERHREIAQLLDLPPASVGVGYTALERGLLPDEVDGAEVRHFGPDDSFADAGQTLRQYALFHPSEGETDGQIAARFLPDVISWEDDFLSEPTPVLGTAAEIQNRFLGQFADPRDESSGNWLRRLDSEKNLFEVDLGGSRPLVESVTLFTLSKDMPTTLLTQLCAGTSWAVWSYETKQVVTRRDVPTGPTYF